MTLSQQIHVDLLAGQSTLDSLVPRMKAPEATVLASLRDDEIAGMVESAPLGPLTVWRLSIEGRAIAETYPRQDRYP